MAKPLAERLNNALTNDRVTITDLRALIVEVGEERDRHAALAQAADADSVDIALSEEARDDAAGRASRSTRLATGYTNALATLEDRLEARLDTDHQRALATERSAALAERDSLAATIADRYAAATDALIALAREIKASDARLSACGLQQELSAEAVARGCDNRFYFRFTPTPRLSELRLPRFDDCADLWPEPVQRVDFDGPSTSVVQASRVRKVRESADLFGRFRLSASRPQTVRFQTYSDRHAQALSAWMANPDLGAEPTISFHTVAVTVGPEQPWEGMVMLNQVDAIRGAGVVAEEVVPE